MTTGEAPAAPAPAPKRELDHIVTLTYYKSFPLPEISVTGDCDMKQVMIDILHAALGIWSTVNIVQQERK